MGILPGKQCLSRSGDCSLTQLQFEREINCKKTSPHRKNDYHRETRKMRVQLYLGTWDMVFALSSDNSESSLLVKCHPSRVRLTRHPIKLRERNTKT